MSRRLGNAQRTTYKISRALGDANTLQTRGPGTLVVKVIKRKYHRKLIALARRGKVW